MVLRSCRKSKKETIQGNEHKQMQSIILFIFNLNIFKTSMYLLSDKETKQCQNREKNAWFFSLYSLLETLQPTG